MLTRSERLIFIEEIYTKLSHTSDVAKTTSAKIGSAGTGHRDLTTTALEPQTGYTATDSAEVL